LNYIYITQYGIDPIIDGAHIELQPSGNAPNRFDTRIRFSDRFNFPINSSIHLPTFLIHPISERNNEAGSVILRWNPNKN